MKNVLLALACLLGFVSILYVNQATLGVGLLAGACLLAILARVTQAEQDHAQLIRELRDALARLEEARQPQSAQPRPLAPGAWSCPRCGQPNSTFAFDCADCNTARPTARHPAHR